MDSSQALQRAFEAGVEHLRREEYEEAIQCFEEGLKLATEQRYQELEASFRLLIGQSAFELDDITRAREELVQAYELFRAVDDPIGQARARLELGELAFWNEQYDLAQRHYQRVLDLLAEVNPDETTSEILALAHVRLGAIAFEEEEKLEAAQAHYQQAFTYYVQIDEPLNAANVVIELASNLQLEDPEQARHFFEEGKALAQQAGDDYLASIALHGLGVLAADQGRWSEALSWYRQALELKERCGDQEGQVFTYLALGVAERELGHQREARAAWQRALRLAKQEDLEDVALVVQALIESNVQDWLRS